MMANAIDQSGVIRGDGGNHVAMLLSEVDPTDGEINVKNHIADPERRLLFAVLTDAIIRFRRFVEKPNDPARHECREAERWIRSVDREWPCSFVNVCEALDIQPESLRRALLRWRLPVAGGKRATRRGLLVKRRRPRRATVGADAVVDGEI